MRARLVAGGLAATTLVAIALMPDAPDAAAVAHARRGTITVANGPLRVRAPGTEHRYTVKLEHATDAFRIAVRKRG